MPQQLPRTVQPPPDVPHIPEASEALTRYLRNFALWAKNGLADKISASVAQPGHMLQAADAPRGTTPLNYTLQVNTAGAITVTPLAVGIGSPAGGGTPGGGGLPGGGGTAAGAPIIIGGPSNAVGVHTADETLNSAVANGGLLQFDTVDNDAASFAPASSPFNHLTIPAGLGGVYSLIGLASVFADASTGTTVGIGVLVNGVQIYATTNQSVVLGGPLAGAGDVTVSYTFNCVATQHLSLSAGDTVQLSSTCSPGPNAFTSVSLALARLT